MVVEIAVPVVVFTAIVLALTAFVLLARWRLEPTGVVTVTVNGATALEIDAGSLLLAALAERQVFLPAACGGRGTCGQCKIKVTSGAAPPLPTEASVLGAGELAAGLRLGCQLKVRAPLGIALPESVLSVRQFSCTVLSNRSVATYLKELVLELPAGQRLGFTAGQYVLLEAPPGRVLFRDFALEAAHRQEWQRHGFLALKSDAREPVVRAYSLANAPQDDAHAVLVVRIATPPPAAPGAPPGRASSYIFALKPGDRVGVSGPFGEFRANDSKKEMLFIGGGAGIAPLRSIILDQLAGGAGRTMSLWYGVRDQLDLCYDADFRELAARHANFEYHVALSSPRAGEAWDGLHGLIHRVVHERYLSRHPEPEEVEYYLCGPPLMTAAVMQMLAELGVSRHNVFFDDFGT